ncbi:hypothetical protein C8R47DRAFT_1170989 [Mycena vitilis]|nr:hypothetical protein C8R47DRAFT_1170989 [Mycena vitilis]
MGTTRGRLSWCSEHWPPQFHFAAGCLGDHGPLVRHAPCLFIPSLSAIPVRDGNSCVSGTRRLDGFSPQCARGRGDGAAGHTRTFTKVWPAPWLGYNMKPNEYVLHRGWRRDFLACGDQCRDGELGRILETPNTWTLRGERHHFWTSGGVWHTSTIGMPGGGGGGVLY